MRVMRRAVFGVLALLLSTIPAEGKKKVGAGLVLIHKHPSRGPLLLLLQRRSKHNDKCWDVPGGNKDPGEAAWETAVRESEEELGSEALDQARGSVQPRGANPHDSWIRHGIYQISWGKKANKKFTLFVQEVIASPDDIHIVLSDETRAKRWVSPSEISELDTGCIHGHIKSFIEDQLATVIDKIAPPDAPSSKPDNTSDEVLGSDKVLGDWIDTGSGSFVDAFANSLVMIWATELGDKTFFIAAILAMRHARSTVFVGAIAALALMTVLSAAMGFALPNVMPRQYTHYASAALFLYFGCKLLYDAMHMDDSVSEECAEAEEELSEVQYDTLNAEDKTSEGAALVELGDEDDTKDADEEPESPPAQTAAVNGQFQVLSQAFTLTFLAEWGDRSQIATVALAADKNPFGVTLGGIVGHSCCTGLAVVTGKLLAERVSERTTTFVGGALFLFFAVHALWSGAEGEQA